MKEDDSRGEGMQSPRWPVILMGIGVAMMFAGLTVFAMCWGSLSIEEARREEFQFEDVKNVTHDNGTLKFTANETFHEPDDLIITAIVVGFIGGIIVYTLGHSFRYEMSVKRKLEIEYARLKRKVEKEGKK